MIRDRLHIALIAVAVANVVAVASLTDRVFDAPYSPLLAILAPIAAAAIAIVNPARRVALRVAPQLALCVVFTALAVLVRHGSLSSDLVLVPFRGLGDIVSARWPAPSEPVGVGAIVLATAVAGAVSAELAWTRRYSALLLAAPMVLLLLVALLAPKAGTAPLPVVVLVVMGSALVLRLAYMARVQRQHQTTMPTERGSNALVGSVIALVALVPAAIGAPFGTTDRFDIREETNDASSITEEISPLSRLDEWRGTATPDELFSVSPADSADARWRFVALTRYDGSAWMPSDDFRPVGEVLGKDSGQTPIERYDVTIGDFEEQWVPFSGIPLRTNLESRIDNTVSGIRLAERMQTDDTYRIELTEPSQSSELLKQRSFDRSVQLPSLGTALGTDLQLLTTLAQEIVANATTEFDQANALARYLSEEFALSADAPAGHRLAQLRVFLTSKQSGRDEQFVAAFAVLARLVDLPARVVVGVRLTQDGDKSVAMSNRVEAWPEIAFESVGWVAFDPIPERIAEQESTTGLDEAAQVGRQVPPPPTTAAPAEQSTTSVQLDDPEGQILAPRNRIVGGVVMALLALLAYVVTVLTMKRNRRQRRAAAERPDVRVAGAFLTNLEEAVDLGAPIAPHLTNRELAARASSVIGDVSPTLDQLAGLATRVVYDRHMPTPETADVAWQEAEQARREIRERVGVLRWGRGRLSIRSLRIGHLEHDEDTSAVAPKR